MTAKKTVQGHFGVLDRRMDAQRKAYAKLGVKPPKPSRKPRGPWD